jgi:class 3 adenylate cyclase
VWGTFGYPTVQNPTIGCVTIIALFITVPLLGMYAWRASGSNPVTLSLVSVSTLGAAPYFLLVVKTLVSRPGRRPKQPPHSAVSVNAPTIARLPRSEGQPTNLPQIPGRLPAASPSSNTPLKTESPALPVRDFPSGTLTFLMTDVESSSELFERHRAAMDQAMARHDRVLAHIVALNGGLVVTQQGEGDSMLAVFTTSRSALNAALDGQRAFHQPDWPVPMRVRMGVLTGDARVVNGNYRGQAINRCGRIRSAAPGGQVFVAQSTATIPDNLPDGATFAKLGEFSLKGLDRPELVFRLVHPDIAEQGAREESHPQPG